MLADYGARVIKVRPPASADLLEAPRYAYSGDRGIERIQLDLKSAGGRAVVDRLLARATVVVESFRPGVAARLGIGFDQVRATRPGIVYCSVSGYGQAQPGASFPGHDLNYLGVAGYLGTTERTARGAPALPGASIADAAGGFAAAVAILAALSSPDRDDGVYLDVSITDATLRFTQMFVDQHLLTGTEVAPGTDQLLGGRACYGIYETGDDRLLTLGALEPRFWRRFCELTELPHLQGLQHAEAEQEAVRAAVATRLRTQSRQHWLDLLSAEVPVGAVNSIGEVVDDPRLGGAPATWTVPTAAGGRVRQLAPRLAGTPPAPDPTASVPSPGSTDTDALLDELGFDVEERAVLLKDGAVR